MKITVIELNQPSEKAIENTKRAIKRVFDKIDRKEDGTHDWNTQN